MAVYPIVAKKRLLWVRERLVSQGPSRIEEIQPDFTAAELWSATS
jgi:hypothetical protein